MRAFPLRSCVRCVALAAAFGAAAAPRAADAPVEITVYAAASLKDALTEIGAACDSRLGVHEVFNFGASNDLARQIVAANKADLFFPADEGWMDRVAEQGLLDTDGRRTLLSNRLVVIVPSDSKLRVNGARDLAGVRHLALANPDAVPAGKYARAWLQKTGMWDGLRNRVAPTPDVRAALAQVEAGAADAAIVYRTDAAIARRAKVSFAIPEDEGPAIAYPLAALRDRPHLDASRRVADCYAAAESRTVFEHFGFIVLDTAGGAGASSTPPPP